MTFAKRSASPTCVSAGRVAVAWEEKIMDRQANEPRANQSQIAPARKRKARLDGRKTGKSIDPERLMKAIRYAIEHPKRFR